MESQKIIDKRRLEDEHFAKVNAVFNDAHKHALREIRREKRRRKATLDDVAPFTIETEGHPDYDGWYWDLVLHDHVVGSIHKDRANGFHVTLKGEGLAWEWMPTAREAIADTLRRIQIRALDLIAFLDLVKAAR